MKKFFKKSQYYLSQKAKYFYKVFGHIKLDSTSRVDIGNNVRIKNSLIILENNSSLRIEDNVQICGYDIYASEGNITIGKNCILRDSPYWKPLIKVKNGQIKIHNNCVLRAMMLVKWGGVLEIGQYTFINAGTEIRCNKFVMIGMFNMIAENCNIFDTNTHGQLLPQERRKRTIEEYPFIGRERERPDSKDVVIGDDVWIGRNSIILKDIKIDSCSIIGAGAVVTHGEWLGNVLLAGNPAKILKEIKHDN